MAATKIVSFSELDAARQCRLKHHLAYKERWQTEETSPALGRGKLFHEVMETHFTAIKGGMTAAGAVQTVNASGLLHDPETAAQTEQQELVEWIYHGYVELYENDPDWEIVEVETHIEDWLPTEKGTRSTFRMKGKVDLLVKD